MDIITSINSKICTKCGNKKLLTNFGCDKYKKDGKMSSCKECANLASIKYQKENYKKYCEYQNSWKRNNRKKLVSYTRSWQKRNINKVKEYNKKFFLKFRGTTRGSLHSRMSSSMRDSLRRGFKNGYSWEKLIGYTVIDLKNHIEKKFTKGMSWELFIKGDIHIDHIIPVSAFNFERPEDIDFKRCWSLSNLQPMWKLDNISKNNKIEKPFQPSLII